MGMDRPRQRVMFLSIVTRTCRRPKALARCIRSLGAQDCQDFEHAIIEDEIGRGVAWANGMMAERDWSDINGDYVYILDDDNKLYNGAIMAMQNGAAANQHDLLLNISLRPTKAITTISARRTGKRKA